MRIFRWQPCGLHGNGDVVERQYSGRDRQRGRCGDRCCLRDGDGPLRLREARAAAGVLTVTAAKVTAIAVTPASATVFVGGAQPYAARCTYSDGTHADCTGTVIWSSSNTAMATVSGAGVATGVAPGTATIRAASGSVSGSESTHGYGRHDDSDCSHSGHGDGGGGRGSAVFGSDAHIQTAPMQIARER